MLQSAAVVDTIYNFTPGITTNNVDLGKDVIVGVMDSGDNFTEGGQFVAGVKTPAVNLQLRIFRECLKKIVMMLLERF